MYKSYDFYFNICWKLSVIRCYTLHDFSVWLLISFEAILEIYMCFISFEINTCFALWPHKSPVTEAGIISCIAMASSMRPTQRFGCLLAYAHFLPAVFALPTINTAAAEPGQIYMFSSKLQQIVLFYDFYFSFTHILKTFLLKYFNAQSYDLK